MQLLLSFFFPPIKAKQGGFFFLGNISLLFGSMPGSSQGAWKERKKIQKYFLLFLTDSWVEGERDSFQFET